MMALIRHVAALAALLMTVSLSAKADTLFMDLGGKPGIERLVTKAMQVWATDARVEPTFAETNRVRFKRQLIDQLCSITGGDCTYTGRSMEDAHKGLHLRTVQFNALAEDLQTAMEQLDISYPVQNRLLALLAPMHRDVVAR